MRIFHSYRVILISTVVTVFVALGNLETGIIFSRNAEFKKDTSNIAGFVFDNLSLEPIGNVQVFMVRGTLELRTKTSNDGSFYLRNLDQGEWMLLLTRTGYESKWQEITITENEKKCMFALTNTGSIKVSVSLPLSFKTNFDDVRLYNRCCSDPLDTVNISTEGKISFDQVNSGTGYYVSFDLSDGFTKFSHIPIHLPDYFDKEYALVKPETQKLTGKVVDKTSGDPVKGAMVTILSDQPDVTGSIQVVTDEHGRYEMENLPDISLVSFVTHPGFLNHYTHVDFKRKSEMIHELDPAIKLKGRLKDVYGNPIKEAKIGLVTTDWNKIDTSSGVLTDSNGRFEIDDVKQRTIALTGEKYEISFPIVPAGKHSPEVYIEGKKAKIEYLGYLRPISLKGRVISDTGPLSNVNVWVTFEEIKYAPVPSGYINTGAFKNKAPSTITDDTGLFSFDHVVADPGNGAITLIFEKQDFVTTYRPFKLNSSQAESELEDLEIIMNPGQNLSGLVILENGTPLSGVDITLDPFLSDSLMPVVTTTSNGRFDFANVSNQPHHLKLCIPFWPNQTSIMTANSYELSRIYMDLKPGIKPVVLKLDPGVLVVSLKNLNLPDWWSCRVGFESTDGKGWTMYGLITSPDKEMMISPIEYGTYKIWVRGPGTTYRANFQLGPLKPSLHLSVTEEGILAETAQ